MKKRLLIFLIIFFILFIFNLNTGAQSELAMTIRNYFIVIDEYDGFFPEGEEIKYYQELMDFYDSRHHRAVWFENEEIINDVESLLNEIENSYYEGFSPADYHYDLIKNCLDDQEFLADDCYNNRALLDILLSHAYLNLASDYLNGKIDPEVIMDDYNYSESDLESQKLMQLLVDKNNITQNLRSNLPENKYYKGLREKLYYYRDSGEVSDWQQVERGEILQLNSQSERVKQLVENLIARNYLKENQLENNNFYSKEVENAVIRFQNNNGLQVDGRVGNNTLAALNISRSDRIKQIIINMERWRWLPENLGSRYVYVNIADFNLKVFEDQEIVMEMKTIVGQDQRKTPVFSDQIRYLVFNPYWHLPKSIAVNDKLPLIKEDINYLEKNNYKVFQYNNNRLVEINPENVDWDSLNRNNFNYILKQEPGDQNALGRVKFMFPNRFSVYLHDTPGKYLFSQTERTFSSGCIRIENPVEFAEYLLDDQTNWDRENIKSEMTKDQEKTVYLNKPINIYIQYNTVWVDDNNQLNFRKDIYERDKTIIEEYF